MLIVLLNLKGQPIPCPETQPKIAMLVPDEKRPSATHLLPLDDSVLSSGV